MRKLVVSDGSRDPAVGRTRVRTTPLRTRKRTGKGRRERKGDSRDFSAIHVYEALEAHAYAQDGDLSGEVLDSIAGDARVGGGVAGTGGDDEGVDLESGEVVWGDGVVADDGDMCAEDGEGLVEVPGEGVKVVD